MKKHVSAITFVLVAIFSLISTAVQAQQPEIQYFRSWDKGGINVFEPSKSADQPEFTGVKVRIGGAFTQTYQSLTHSNEASYVPVSPTNSTNRNLLYGTPMTNTTLVNARPLAGQDTSSITLSGFNLAMANLNLDFQIDDGIRVSLENYMSTRHHNEFWVKGGYIQIDKLPMFGSPDWYTKYVRVKIGHFTPNFGDAHYRRNDGGNAMFNPFGENLIMDAFTTEIGGEVYVFPAEGLMVMGGMSSGLINGNVENYPTVATGANLEPIKRNPSIFAKAAYDNTFEGFRFRLSASLYHNSSIQRNTLYAGDRTGSQYFSIMDAIVTAAGAPTDKTAVFTSGRINPNITNRLTAFVVSPFVKYKGFELFGAFETISGGNYNEAGDRTFTQIAADGVYRFLKDEQAFVGARYATVSGRFAGFAEDVTVTRTSISAGWFPTRNLLLKGEYVMQDYADFPTTDFRYNGNFNGFVIQAVIGL